MINTPKYYHAQIQSSDRYQVGAWAIALLNTFLGLADHGSK
ncbi:hypothetical protein [Nostoc sp.]